MQLPDLQSLANAGGWVVAVGIVIAVLGLIVLGKLVPGPTHDREVRRGDALDSKLEELTGVLRDQTGYLKFVADFVQGLVRDRQGGNG